MCVYCDEMGYSLQVSNKTKVIIIMSNEKYYQHVLGIHIAASKNRRYRKRKSFKLLCTWTFLFYKNVFSYCNWFLGAILRQMHRCRNYWECASSQNEHLLTLSSQQHILHYLTGQCTHRSFCTPAHCNSINEIRQRRGLRCCCFDL